MFLLFKIAKKWKQPECPSTEEWMDKTWSLHTAAYYSAMKRNEGLMHAATRVNLENTVLSERSQTQGATYAMTPFIASVQNRQIQRHKSEPASKFMVAGGWERGELVVTLDVGFPFGMFWNLW